MLSRATIPSLVAIAVAIVGCAAEDRSSPISPTPVSIASGSIQAVHNDCHPDTTPPSITNVSASPNALWPPNHKMWNVRVAYDATDACGPVECSLAVSSDEPVNGRGDGNTSPDWVVVNDHLVQLRAERQGGRNGRVYTVRISCVDTAVPPNAATETVRVTVAHDQGK
jgi:hypothetical protein